MCIGRIPADIGRKIATNRQSGTPAIIVVHPFAGRNIPDIAFVILPIPRRFDRKARCQWQVDRPARQFLVIAAIADFGITAHCVAGLAHDHADRAARRVAPEQRALWPAQNFDAFDIEQRQIIGILAADINIVDVSADRRVEGRNSLCIAKPAQEVRVGGAQPRIILCDEIWHILGKLQGIVGPLRFDLRRRESRNRNRHVLHALRAALGGHDNVADAPLVFFCRCGCLCS